MRHNIVCSPLNLVHYALFWVPNFERHPTTLKVARLLALVNPDGDLHPDIHFLLPSGRVRRQWQGAEGMVDDVYELTAAWKLPGSCLEAARELHGIDAIPAPNQPTSSPPLPSAG